MRHHGWKEAGRQVGREAVSTEKDGRAGRQRDRQEGEGGERDAAALTEGIRREISSEPMARIDYVEAVAWDSLEPVSRVEGEVLIAIAVYIADRVRLIDNIIISL